MASPNYRRPAQKQPSQEASTKSTSNTILIIFIILAVIALALAGYFFGYPLIKSFLETRNTTTIVENLPEDSDPLVEEPPAAVGEEPTSAVPKGYYIIVGSFRDQNNANQMAKNMSNDIKLDVIHFEETGVYRVSAGYYENITNAYNVTVNLQDMNRYPNAWVLEYL